MRTVEDLAALVHRTKTALAEGGRPDLANRCNALVDEHGAVRLCFNEITTLGEHAPEVLKAISIDPDFEMDS